MLLFGENIGAEEALRWGLVEKVVESEALDEAVDAWIGQLEKNGPLAVRRQKALMRRWEDLGMEKATRAGVDVFGESFVGEESEAGRMLGAFVKGRL